jgi:hypothetical protein
LSEYAAVASQQPDPQLLKLAEVLTDLRDSLVRVSTDLKDQLADFPSPARDEMMMQLESQLTKIRKGDSSHY